MDAINRLNKIITVILYVVLFASSWCSTSLSLELMAQGIEQKNNIIQTWACVALTLSVTAFSCLFKRVLDWLFSKVLD